MADGTDPAKKAPAKKAPAKKAPAKKAPASAAAPSDAVEAAGLTSKSKKGDRRSKRKKSPGKRAKAASKQGTKSAKKSVRKASRKASRKAPDSKFFTAARKRATAIIDSPEKLTKLAAQSSKSISENSGPLGEVLDDLKAMIRLVVAYARGNYRDISADTLVLTVAALLYVVMPLDLIPDALPGVGLLDDVFVVGWVLKQTRHELDRFRDWENGNSGTSGVGAKPTS